MKPSASGERPKPLDPTFFANLFDAIPDTVVVAERDWRISFANRAAVDHAGRSLAGGAFFDVCGEIGLDVPADELRRAMTRRVPVHLESGDGSKGWLDVRAFPVEAGLLVIGQDVTHRRDLEAQINETLNERVKERTADLQAANAEMEGFTYSVSHDLRAPLRAIISTSMILLEESRGVLSADARDLLIRQAAAAKKVGSLIDELLKLSRISRQSLVSEPVDLALIASDVVHELQSDGRAGNVTFDISPRLTAHGDARLLRFVLLNLIENACKFSASGGTVTVGEEDGAFFVRDEGIGFDMAYVHKLFLPFERLVNESDYPGTGIGLANVQRIVHRHGGRVWAESEPGKGATFFFTLGE